MAYENKKKHIPNALLFACSNEKSIKKKMSFCVVTCNSDDRLSILVKKEHMTMVSEYDTSLAGMAYVC